MIEFFSLILSSLKNDVIGWSLTAISIFGGILNARRNRLGFIFFIASNVGWILWGIIISTYSQIPMWIVFTVISAYGLIHWKNKESPRERRLLNRIKQLENRIKVLEKGEKGERE